MGAPLRSISALIPPATQHAYTQHALQLLPENKGDELCGPAKYADKLHLPQNLNGYFDYEQGLECAKEQGKPAFVVFKGHACANCKKMENSVWTDPETIQMLSEKFVVVALYTDDRTKLPEEEWVTSSIDGKVKDTMGKKNLDIQISKYNTNSIPFHVIVMPDGTEQQMGVTFDNDEFKNFLKQTVQ